MKRYLYLYPLMAITAASLSLGACGKKDEDKTDQTTTTSESTTPATTDTVTSTTTPAVPAQTSGVTAEGAMAYATAPGGTTGAVFLTLHNTQTTVMKLTSIKTDVAATADIHQNDNSTGTMIMKKVDSLEIQPGQQVDFKPDGYHIMLNDLKAPLTVGQTFNITMSFEGAPDVTVPVSVTAAGASGSPMGSGTMNSGSASGSAMPDASGAAGSAIPSPTSGSGSAGSSSTTPDSTSGTMASPSTSPTSSNGMAPGTTDTTSSNGSATSGSTPDSAATSSAPNASTTTPTATGTGAAQ